MLVSFFKRVFTESVISSVKSFIFSRSFLNERLIGASLPSTLRLATSSLAEGETYCFLNNINLSVKACVKSCFELATGLPKRCLNAFFGLAFSISMILLVYSAANCLISSCEILPSVDVSSTFCKTFS